MVVFCAMCTNKQDNNKSERNDDRSERDDNRSERDDNRGEQNYIIKINYIRS